MCSPDSPRWPNRPFPGSFSRVMAVVIGDDHRPWACENSDVGPLPGFPLPRARPPQSRVHPALTTPTDISAGIPCTYWTRFRPGRRRNPCSCKNAGDCDGKSVAVVPLTSKEVLQPGEGQRAFSQNLPATGFLVGAQVDDGRRRAGQLAAVELQVDLPPDAGIDVAQPAHVGAT